MDQSLKDQLESILYQLEISTPPGIASDILDELASFLEIAVADVGIECVTQVCDQYLRSEIRSTSLNSLLVSLIGKYPEALGDACERCLHLITPSTVACGASRGKLITIELTSDVKFRMSLGDFHDEWTGCRVWPGAVHMSRMLLASEFDVGGSHVLELGSGVGTCGVAAIHSGARTTTFTEYKQSLLEDALSNAERNFPLDSVSKYDGFILDWTDFDAETHKGFENFRSSTNNEEFVVIGSELIYDLEHADPVINVLSQLFRNGASRGLIVVMLKPMRDGVKEFLEKLRELPATESFKCRIEEKEDEEDQLAARIYLDRNLS